MGHTNDSATLTQVLLACSNVTDLSYSCMPNSLRMFETIIGDFSNPNKHHSLRSLTLTIKGYIINGHDMDGILLQCPNLNRLVIKGCHASILNSISKYAPSLKILVLNPSDHNDPTLTRDLSTDNHYDGDGISGIQILIIYNIRGAIPIIPALSFIYKYRATLKTLYMGILDEKEISDEQQVERIKTDFPNFKLWNLESLNYHDSPNAPKLVLGMLHNVTTIKTLNVFNLVDFGTLLGNIEQIPSVTCLNLMGTHSINMGEEERSNFHQLIEIFAKRSVAGLPSLQKITLQDIPSVNDQILYALGDIKTLCNISFGMLSTIEVSTEGINNLIQKIGAQLTDIKFFGMRMVLDSTLTALCDCSNLVTVELQHIDNVTIAAIDDLLDKTTSGQLKQVNVKGCYKINGKWGECLTKRS
ncbi:hypothetical protein BDA99DRAFT_360037 [Phascolomyces articulosus]|uniref:RNI-like protein n=1 Tax=Phascolomyces articulosus TaxID=60185 RepID=A0AAD5PFW2_9FUNG|nr:hypothetical protein BDA99DRAFT_360037 [Phascolomyces articulosus]